MLDFQSFIQNINSITLPSLLWAVHIDPVKQFVAVLHVDMRCNKVAIDKGVLFTFDDCIKSSVSLNDEIIQLPDSLTVVETISDLNNLVKSIHNVKICSNNECKQYVFDEHSDFCESCNFESSSDDTSHYLQNSSDEDNELKKIPKATFLCTICGKIFTCTSGLNHHMLTHADQDNKPFKCKTCMKTFAKKYNLIVHERVHSGEKPYVCSQCGKTYSTRSNLSTHMKSVHCLEKRHRCDLCDMSFVHPRVLRIHMRKHTGEKPFMCQICGKFFSKNIHLTVHMRIHTGEKPYDCNQCGKAFSTTGNLKTHKKNYHIS